MQAVFAACVLLCEQIKPTVRYGSEFVEKERKIKSLLFRHFIYVNLGIAVEVYQNLPFTCKNA